MSSADSRLEIHLQIFGSCHEIALPDIRNDDLHAGAQSLTARRTRSRGHPFPTLGCLFAETAAGKEPKLPVASRLRVKHLNARKMRTDYSLQSIQDVLVDLLYSSRIDLLRSDLLQALCELPF